MKRWHRRELLASAASFLAGPLAAKAEVISGALPWRPDAADPPRAAELGPWLVFTDAEGAALEALVDRLIPPDAETPGGKEAGCAVYIDRQLAGPYGRFGGIYRSPPFLKGTKQQGDQGEETPTTRYRKALAALDAYCRRAHGKGFVQLPETAQDELIGGLESKTVSLPDDVDGQAFFELLLKNTHEGFFADPIYGGNKNMVAWTMIGFPGARYDYRDWIDRHNERYPLPPVGIMGRPAWSAPQKS